MNNDMEQNFQKRKNILHDSYASSGVPLSAEEETSLTPILNLLKGQKTRYNEPELVAEGGEKQIYRVYDQHLNRFVAMAKTLKAESPLGQEQFLREGQLTANLTHPNIVPIYNMGIGADGAPFFSMELIPGDSLKDIIQKVKDGDASYKAQYSMESLLGIFNKVCDAVAYAHSRNVLHLDIKPDNIRVGQFGEVFLCDWGLARVEGHIDSGEPEQGQLDSDILNDITLSGIIKGTPGFMAPEQVAGLRKSRQTDIYALGAILYMIQTNELPVAGENTHEVMKNTRNGKVIPPRIRRPGRRIPSGLAAVAMKALANNPENRYPDVQQLQNDINRFLAGHPTEAEHAGLLTRMILMTQRHRELTFWLMAFFALLTVVVSINLTIIQHEKRIADENFALYKKEQNEATRISAELAALSYHAQGVRSYISARSMIPVLEQLLEQTDITEKTRQKILNEKVRTHLMLQHFNEAKIALNQLQNPGKYELEWLVLFREYAALKPNDGMLLPDGELAQLLNHTEIINRDLSVFLYFHYANENPKVVPEEHIKLVAVMLSRLNEFHEERIPTLKLSKRAEGYHLDLSHTPYSTFLVTIPLVYRTNILRPLNLYSLDISHTPISLARELKQLKIKELRMVGVSLKPINTLPWILQEIGLERVILGKGEYPESVIKKIRYKGIEVVEEDPNES